MNRLGSYLLLYVVVLLLQVFLFDKLLIFSTVAPLIYIIFVVLLPIQTSQFQMLLWGLFVGVTFDVAMGTSGLNTIATLAVCYLRIKMLTATVDKDLLVLGGAPTLDNLGFRRFIRYMIAVVILHNIIFFAFESLNFVSLNYLLTRFLISGSVSLVVGWLIAGRFEQILSRRI